MVLPTVIVSLTAVLVATLATMVVGFLWYSPALFGKIWIHEMKLTKQSMEKAKQKGMGKTYFLAFITTFITAYVLAHFAAFLSLTTFNEAFQLAFWTWLGFFATTQLGSVLWEGKSLKLYFINVLHHFVALVIMAAILVAW